MHMALEERLILDQILSANLDLLYADVSKNVTIDTFIMLDTRVLNAIASRTLGRLDMSPLSCIVFLANSIQPGRGNTPACKTLKQISQENIDK